MRKLGKSIYTNDNPILDGEEQYCVISKEET